MNVPLFVKFPATYRSLPDVEDRVRLPALETDPVTVSEELVLPMLNAPVPTVVNPPPIVIAAFKAFTLNVAPVFTVNVPFNARAVFEPLTISNVPVLIVTLFG